MNDITNPETLKLELTKLNIFIDDCYDGIQENNNMICKLKEHVSYLLENIKIPKRKYTRQSTIIWNKFKHNSDDCMTEDLFDMALDYIIKSYKEAVRDRIIDYLNKCHNDNTEPSAYFLLHLATSATLTFDNID